MKNGNRYWFKRRRYGYGWTPVTLQGWLVVVVAVIIILLAALVILPAKPAQLSLLQATIFSLVLLSVIMMLIGISFMKGPSPRWRWGGKPENPDEDI